MKLFISLSIFILLFNVYKTQRTRFSVACGRFQDNEKLFFGNCTLNENAYDRIVEFTNYILSNNPNLNIDFFIRNYLFVNSTQYFRATFPNASYIQKLDLFISELSLVMTKLESSLSKVDVSEFFDAAKNSNFSQVLAYLVNQRDSISATNWTEYQNLYCNQGKVSFCKSAQGLLNVTYVDELSNNTVLELLKLIFERAYAKINSIVLLPEKDFILEKLKKIDSQGLSGALLSEVHEIMKTTLFNYTVEYFTGYSPIFTTKKPTTTSTIKKTTTKEGKVLEIVAVSEAVYLSIPLTILFVTLIVTVVLVVLKQSTSKKFEKSKNSVEDVYNLNTIKKSIEF